MRQLGEVNGRNEKLLPKTGFNKDEYTKIDKAFDMNVQSNIRVNLKTISLMQTIFLEMKCLQTFLNNVR